AFLVHRIVAVFADAQHAFDGQLFAAQGQGAFDGVIDGEAVFLGQAAAQVVRGKLIGIQRYQLQVRSGSAVLLVSFQDLADDHVVVVIFAVLRDNGGYFFRLVHGHSRRKKLRG